jgi:hypothetical protein
VCTQLRYTFVAHTDQLNGSDIEINTFITFYDIDGEEPSVPAGQECLAVVTPKSVKHKILKDPDTQVSSLARAAYLLHIWQ